MARITVEDCIDKFESRFELVLVASNRARKLHSGENPTVEKDNDKPTVIALREIADETVSVDALKDKLIQEYQTVSPLDEEELSLDYAGSEIEMNEEVDNEESQEANEKLSEDEGGQLDGNDDSRILNQNENQSKLTINNEGYIDVTDNNIPENI